MLVQAFCNTRQDLAEMENGLLVHIIHLVATLSSNIIGQVIA